MNTNLSSYKLKVVEIFYSIQGEGANFGKPAIFIRLSKCNKNCWFCDTDWNKGQDMLIEEILETISKYRCNTIIWTGGEPTLQLTAEILDNFSLYYNCIETNGTNPVPRGIDYITCSPKVTPDVLRKNFDFVNEFRYPIAKGEVIPKVSELPKADNYFVSPLFLGEEKKRFEIEPENVDYCLEFVKNNPQWRISLQMHKILNVR